MKTPTEPPRRSSGQGQYALDVRVSAPLRLPRTAEEREDYLRTVHQAEITVIEQLGDLPFDEIRQVMEMIGFAELRENAVTSASISPIGCLSLGTGRRARKQA